MQRQPVATANSTGTDAVAEVEILRRFNELRSELLDHREKTVDWWLAATAIFLTLLGIVAVIAGYLGFKRFSEIETEARGNMESSRKHAEEIRGLVGKIKEKRDEAESLVKRMTAEMSITTPDEARKSAKSVQEDPTASSIDQTVDAAVLLQRQGRIEESIEKWRAIAIVSEGSNKELAAQAWFSVGYLIQEHRKDTLEAAIDAYNKAIRLKIGFSEAYNNRGTIKNDLGQHEEAITDYDEAIRLKPDYAEAYSNRGNAKDNLGRHEEAVADHDEAIRLKPDYAKAYSNRGNSKDNLGHYKEAVADYDEAIRLKPDYAEAYNNRGIAKNNLGRHEGAIADYDEAIRLKPDLAIVYNNRGKANISMNRMDEARRDFETAITLARDAGNEALANDAERALKKLSDEQDP